MGSIPPAAPLSSEPSDVGPFVGFCSVFLSRVSLLCGRPSPPAHPSPAAALLSGSVPRHSEPRPGATPARARAQPLADSTVLGKGLGLSELPSAFQFLFHLCLNSSAGSGPCKVGFGR